MTAQGLAVAVDLGTTNLCVSLLDLDAGRRLASTVAPNPQAGAGADVMSRLLAAQEPVVAQGLRRSVAEAVGELAGRLCAGEGRRAQEVRRVAVVGNSVMLALLTRRGLARLLDPEDWLGHPDPSAAVEGPATDGSLFGALSGAEVEVLPRLGGFVGSDLLAGLLSTGLAGPGVPGMLVDVGTNTELALWGSREILVCSAAGGPAFEGVGVSCGMPALPGAVDRIEDHGAGTGEAGWRLHVLGGGEPAGICASGLVDLIALARRSGRITESGRLRPLGSGPIALPGTGLSLSHRDLDLLQRAKAALGAGAEVLCRAAGVRPQQLRVLHVAGAFGSFLDVANAIEIGLIPPLDPSAVRVAGNSALAGCERYLLRPQDRQRAGELRDRITVTNLAASPDFEALFFEHLFLRPGRGEGPPPYGSGPSAL